MCTLVDYICQLTRDKLFNFEKNDYYSCLVKINIADLSQLIVIINMYEYLYLCSLDTERYGRLRTWFTASKKTGIYNL